jgi:CHAT domain-containing protein
VELLADVSPAELPRDDQEFELARLGGVASDAAACGLQAKNEHAAVRLLEQGRGIVLARGELAFLSACETARISPALVDEIVHLASVLHAAGYRHVVATLWAIADPPALRLARAVYTDSAEHDDVTRVPVALHSAVLQLRERYPGRPLTLANYVHMGP